MKMRANILARLFLMTYPCLSVALMPNFGISFKYISAADASKYRVSFSAVSLVIPDAETQSLQSKPFLCVLSPSAPLR